MARTTSQRRLLQGGVALAAASVLILSATVAASADTVIDGPVDTGTADTFAVLAASAITNTGPSVINGDVGISPNPATSVTGLDGGQGAVVNGERFYDDAVAERAQQDAAIAFGVADSLTPTAPPIDITQLNGLSLSPGTYTGGAVELAENGTLAFAGSARSVWVMQVESSLTIGSATTMTFSGGASACNVFWQVGSSATLGSAADFAGTIVAQASISLVNGADVQGQLIALTGAVTLDTNTITVPAPCPTTGSVSETTVPSITSPEPTDGTVGTPYDFTVTADGTPAPTYTVTGELPTGLTIDGVTGAISGTPTTPGDFTFTVVADNPDNVNDSETYTVTIVEAPPVVVPPVVPPGPEQPVPPTVPGPSGPGETPPTVVTPGGGGGGPTVDRLSATGGSPLTGVVTAAIALIFGAFALMFGVPRLRAATGRIERERAGRTGR